MVVKVVVKVGKFCSNKLIKLNNGVEYVLNLPKKLTQLEIWFTKITGAASGTVAAGKGTVDFIEAVACQDGVCAVISAIGLSADIIQTATSFIPGANVTTVVTLPISWGCKSFVYCCKRSFIKGGIC